MLAPWAIAEMKTVELDDKRLDARLTQVLSALAEHPTASIPAACGGRAEMTAAYRFFENENVTFDRILKPHCDATRQRMSTQPIVILVQDTTEIDVTRPEQQVTGAGPLDDGARRGALLHPLHAFTPNGTPLGTVHATAWIREEGKATAASLTRAERAAIPIEEKESYRWVTTLRQAQQEARHCPNTQFISVADSEADVFEVFVQAASDSANSHWIVRAGQDRALCGENGRISEVTLLREQVLAQPVLFENTISVRGRKSKLSQETRGRRQPRDSREADVAVRATRVTLRGPWRADRTLPAVTVNVVLVCEINPPPNDQPVEWLLITSLPIDDAEQVRRVIQYYTVRWMIEVFFRVLKSGCRVEERLFEYMDRLLNCLAVYMIAAWRTLYVCRLGRSCPDISCETIFEPAEWKSVWKVVRREDPPAVPPSLGVFVRLVAQLGGYVNRKRAAPPGPQTVWIGLQRMHDIANCWVLFGPGSPLNP
jgi:hypothetical protein